MAEQDAQRPQAAAAGVPPWEAGPATPAPRDARLHAQVVELAGAAPEAVLEAVELAGQVTVLVPLERLAEVFRVCRERLGYDYLVDCTAVDWRDRPEGRFDVVWWLHRHGDERRLRLKVRVADGVEVPSATGEWRTANWMEREVWDMFGIRFAGHPNLERILTWEGFTGHPLRKDFPVVGIDTGAAVQPDTYPPGGGPATAGGGE